MRIDQSIRYYYAPPVPVPGLVVVGAVPRPAAHFVDRAQVSQLRDALVRVRVAVVCGMRGAGKTQVAAAHAREVMAAGVPGMVGWIGAETRDSTLAGLSEAASALGVADPEGDSLVSARRFRDHLNSEQGLSGVLVFDNATDPDFLDEFLPTCGGIQVVITSTDRAFTGFGETVDTAEGFDRAESVEYLRRATGLDDLAGADGLAGEVGDLPLALAAAAATIAVRRLDYSGYRQLLAVQPLPAAMPQQRGGGYGLAVDQALGLVVDTVTAPTGDAALDARVGWLLGVIAMLSPDGVEAAMFPDPDYRVGAAIARCVEGSLVSWSATGPVLVMHRLTGRVIRERAHATGTLDTLAATAAAVLTPQLFDQDEAFRRRGEGTRLVDHIESLSGAIDQHPAISADTHAAVLSARRWATRQLIEAPDLNRAIPLAERTHTDHLHHLGPDHIHTLIARHNLANAYREAGRVAEAMTLYEQLLADRQQVLGDDHPHTLTTRDNFAKACREAGRVGEAITLLERLLADRERVLGEDHPDTFITRNSLAGAYREAGRVGEAITLLEPLLADREQVLGEDHPDTLSTRHSLAYANRGTGRVDEEIILLERLLADRQRVLGSDHPDTLRTRHSLAYAYREAGRVGEAMSLLERLLADRERVLGEDHPDTFITRNSLAGAYREAGRVGEAITLLERLLADRQRVLGEDHPYTLITRHNLAYAFELAGQVGAAITLYEQILADCERVLDPDHPLTVRVGNTLAAVRRRRRGHGRGGGIHPG
ncbi:FxSxx-COOH system tetratricopeptide repeat protein [Nocardia sp. NPDC003999]